MRFHALLFSFSKFASVILTMTLLGLQLPPAYAAHGLYTSNLNGAQEVPPTATTATGTGNLTLTGSAITSSISISGLTSTPIAAHIHQGAPGVNGPIILTLAPGPSLPMPGSPANYNCPVGSTLTAAQIADLDAGNLYFNVHTAAFPGGEVRGQILHAPLAGPAATIPTLSQWGVVLLSLLIASVIGWRKGFNELKGKK